MTNKKYSGQCIHGIPSCDGDSNERSVAEILGSKFIEKIELGLCKNCSNGKNNTCFYCAKKVQEQVLNKTLKPEDVCVLDIEKALDFMREISPSFREISSFESNFIVHKLRDENCVKFREV